MLGFLLFLLVFEAVEESFGGHGFGVFGNELVDDEIFAVGAELIEFGFGRVGAVSGGNDAVFAVQIELGFWKTSKSYDFTDELL